VFAAAMARALFEVRVLPYAPDAFAQPGYAVFRTSGRDGRWHAIAGGGERGETPLDGARRHARRQGGLAGDTGYVALDSRAVVTRAGPAGEYEVPEYAFAVRTDPGALSAPAGLEYRWVTYEIADGLLACESERDALWELARRIGWRPACR